MRKGCSKPITFCFLPFFYVVICQHNLMSSLLFCSHYLLVFEFLTECARSVTVDPVVSKNQFRYFCLYKVLFVAFMESQTILESSNEMERPQYLKEKRKWQAEPGKQQVTINSDRCWAVLLLTISSCSFCTQLYGFMPTVNQFTSLLPFCNWWLKK